MDATCHSRGEIRVIELLPGGQLDGETAALEVIQLCAEFQAERVLIPAGGLGEAFFNLRSGAAGDVLRKFSMYRVTAAAVASPEEIGQGKFYEFALETNRGSTFRLYSTREAALDWLLAA